MWGQRQDRQTYQWDGEPQNRSGPLDAGSPELTVQRGWDIRCPSPRHQHKQLGHKNHKPKCEKQNKKLLDEIIGRHQRCERVITQDTKAFIMKEKIYI